MNKYIAVMLSGLVMLAVGCKKNDERPKLPAGHPSIESGMAGSANMLDMPKVERDVVVPKEVKAKWKSVKLTVTDKISKNSKEYTVAIGKQLVVPDSSVTIRVLAFLPDFRMDEKSITSASDEPKNPAAQVLIRETGRDEWKGWLYSMHPGVHPYEHQKIGISLVAGVAQ